MTHARFRARIHDAFGDLFVAILVTINLLACLSTELRITVHNKDCCLRAVVTSCGACTRFFKMALAINWAFCCGALLGDLCSINCGAAVTATYLLLRDSEGLGPCAWTTHCGVVTRCVFSFAIAILNLSLVGFEVVAFALAPFAPGTFAWFRATRQFALSLSGSLVIARTTARSVDHVDNVAACLGSVGSTFHAVGTSTAIGAHAPVLPMANTIFLTWFCAASMALLGAACSRARLATMSSLCDDGVHPVLESTITTCRTRTVLTPLPLAIDCTCGNVARS